MTHANVVQSHIQVTWEAEARGRMVSPVSLMTASKELWRGSTGGGGAGGGGEGGGEGGGDGGGAARQERCQQAGRVGQPFKTNMLCEPLNRWQTA